MIIVTSLTAGELAELLLLETREGQHTHYFISNGRKRQPVELPEARELRRAGVPMPLDNTRPLCAAEDGE